MWFMQVAREAVGYPLRRKRLAGWMAGCVAPTCSSSFSPRCGVCVGGRGGSRIVLSLTDPTSSFQTPTTTNSHSSLAI